VLAPDVRATERKLRQQVNAALPVTTYCQAAITLLPPFTQPLKQPQVQRDIATIEADAQIWLSGLCQRFAAGVPQMFVDFAETFTGAMADLTAACNALEANPLDADARKTLISVLAALADQFAALGSTGSALQTDVKAFLQTIDGDAKLMQNDLATIASSVPHGDAIVQQLNATLAVSFFSSQSLSPCLAIITIQESISIEVTQLGASAPALVPLALAKAILVALSTNNQAAAVSLAAILDTLEVLLTKYRSVLASIRQASAPDLPPILRQLDLEDAAAAWQQLSRFASSLINR
jgi:hypothetical protein